MAEFDSAAAGRESAEAARAMGLSEGDKVAIAGDAYVVTRISDDDVEGVKVAENGYRVRSSDAGGRPALYPLDMSLPGWALVGQRAMFPLPGRADAAIRLAAAGNGVLDAAADIVQSAVNCNCAVHCECYGRDTLLGLAARIRGLKV